MKTKIRVMSALAAMAALFDGERFNSAVEALQVPRGAKPRKTYKPRHSLGKIEVRRNMNGVMTATHLISRSYYKEFGMDTFIKYGGKLRPLHSSENAVWIEV
jgi:hypothetical protein